MMNRKNIFLSIVTALALGLVGCGDDEVAATGGTGGAGTGGTGGGGGSTTEMAMVTVAHFAPEVPSAMDTNVDIIVSGDADAVIEDLAYGESTGRVELPPGTYTFAVAVAGETDPVLTIPDVPLAAGTDITVVAYRSGEEAPASPVAVFVFDNSTEGLDSGSGRVFVGHGADDAALDGVNIVTADGLMPTMCMPLILDFAFGTTAPGAEDPPLDLDVDEVFVAFDLDDTCPPATLGPLAVPVNDNVVSLLVAVDEDTTDGLDVELWAIVDASDAPIPLINADPES